MLPLPIYYLPPFLSFPLKGGRDVKKEGIFAR